ncbi:YtxH domain-containing protein [Mucilaginibacter sp. SMC90]|uniref:YtxH domain-containing protein n=1 Tax=Mucilaginibacter sp. SMC90 TaxID=2929803 RepID=UPI001FB45AA7|nr:YtxH domain-containing protein [Mucilaginibacter sp. SMC90]UOE52853.1 YtxH domain-containing protein [Mucilaginibacter sp. SMC90]
MGTIKTFLLGAGTAYAIYFITRKRKDGTSILDELLDNPSLYMNKAKDYAIAEMIYTVKQKLR